MPEEKQEGTIEVNFSLEPSERLKIEIEACGSSNGQNIGKHLLEEFTKDSGLAKAYFDRKITLKKVMDYVQECAKKKLNSKNGFISDDEVYGWAIHFVQDAEVKIPEAETITLTKQDKEAARLRAIKALEQEELEKLKKQKEKEEQARINKEKKEREKEQERLRLEAEEAKKKGQMSLFDFFGDNNE